MTDIDATRPRIRPHPERDGVQLVDPIQSTQFSLLTPEPVDQRPCDPDRFYFPVDTAATLETDVVETQKQVTGWIREETGETVTDITDGESVTVPPGRYNVELSTTRIRVQLVIQNELAVEPSDNRTQFRTGGTEIHVGIRSTHEQPAGTVTTTDEPEDVMSALSTLGSALKTTSCERSFPTLRGHPPLVERGDTLSVPDGIDPPETGVTIEVPPSLEYIYPVTPLAYYLGATVEPGDHPSLVTDDWTHPLAGSDGFETTVARVLKQVFLLDCVTRTEGYYEVDLHERHLAEDAVELDFTSLYDRPLTEQLRAYLDVPWETLTEAVPTWKLTADVAPDVEYVSTLPFLAEELAVIRCRDLPVASSSGDELTETVAAVSGTRSGLVRGDTRTRQSRASATQTTEPVVRLAGADSIERAYIGEGTPVAASKMTADAYYRRLAYEPSTDPHISVVVVCNDEQMVEENVVSDIYGTREWIEFDIVFEEALTAAEMRALLRTDADFLHYIGHVDEDGIRCVDGHLDARTLSEVNASAFILNACDSYEQSRALVDHGAMAGIATVTEVNNQAATSVGRTVARLLNEGFSMASTLALINEYEQIGHHYMIVGDGSLSVVKNNAGTPHHAEVQETADGEYQLSLYGYPRLDSALGALFTPFVPGHTRRYLNTGRMCTLSVSRDELNSFLTKQHIPLIQDEELSWSEELLN